MRREYIHTNKKLKCTRGHVFLGVDGHERNVYRLKRPRLVRFTDYNPVHQLEGYCYNLLLKTYATRSENGLISAGVNPSESYFVECQLRGLLDTAAKMEAHLSEYANRHLYSAEHFQQMVETTTAGLTFRDDLDLSTPQDGDEPPYTTTPARLRNALEDNAEWTPWEGLPDPTEQQQQAIDDILTKGTGLFKLVGGPGRGKSVLIKHLVQRLRTAGKSVVVCASTAKAARLLEIPGATTWHRTVGLKKKGTYAASLTIQDDRYQRLLEAHVIIIEECSMLANDVIYAGIDVLKDIWGHRMSANWPDLCGKSIIFVGDTGQLPPVCSHNKHVVGGICTRCHISQNTYYNRATAHYLTEPLRHLTDPDLTKFLDIVRERRPTMEEITEYLGQCFVGEDVIKQRLASGSLQTIICTHRDDVHEYNSLAMNCLFPAAVQVPIHCNRTDHPGLKQWLEEPNWHELPSVAPGCKVMFTDNYYHEKGGANGATGTVSGLYSGTRPYQEGHHITMIMVKLDDDGTDIKVTRTKAAHDRIGNTNYVKKTFPLTLSYAFTAHKAQGSTIPGDCVLHVKEAFAPGMLYVMLSRVTTRQRLRIVGTLAPEDFDPIPQQFRT